MSEWKKADDPPTTWDAFLCWSKHDGFNIFFYQLKDGGLDGRKAGNWYQLNPSDYGDYTMNSCVTHWRYLPIEPVDD